MAAITLTPPQSRFASLTPARFPAFVGGFGSGKTYALCVRMILLKIKYPDVSGLLVAPTYALSRDIHHPTLSSILDMTPLKYKINKSANFLDIQGYGRILLKTAEQPEKMVGLNAGFAGLDELDTLSQDQASHLWTKVIARIRQKSRVPGFKNSCAVATTPEGHRFIYNRWYKNPPSPEYELIRAPTSSNPHLPDDYIDSLRASYPEHLVNAYINGEFVNLTSGTVYFGFSPPTNTHTRFPPSLPAPLLPNVSVGIDFNVYNTAAVCGFMDNGNLYIYQEYVGVRDTPTMLSYLESDQLRYSRSVTFYPDASGTSRTSTNASTSDLRLLNSPHWTSVDAPRKNPAIVDRVAAVNAAFHKGKVFIHATFCPLLTEALTTQAYDTNGKPDKSLQVTTPTGDVELDHILDAFGYLTARLFPVGGVPSLSSRRLTF